MDIGLKAYGQNMKKLVGIFLVITQVGFSMSYMYFIGS